MSIRTCVARAFCVLITSGLVSMPDPASAREAARPPNLDRPIQRPVAMASPPLATAGTGLLLDRLSEEQMRTWRTIEEVVAESDGSGAPRSQTLRNLWEWAQTSGHAIHVEIVPAASVPTGIAGIFRVERVGAEGQGHVAVLKLCLENIRHAVVGPRPGSVDSFARFEGLSEVERYAEVLAHELAHAVHDLESPDLPAQHAAARRAAEEFFAGTERVIARLPPELQHRLRQGRVLLAATEEYADSVEAEVLRELTRDRR